MRVSATTIVTFLELEGFPVEAVSNTREAMERLENGLPAGDFRYIHRRSHRLDILMAAKQRDPNCPVILMSARGPWKP